MRARKNVCGLQITLLEVLIVIGAVAGGISATRAQNAKHQESARKSDNTQLVARGEYIVNNVAVCSQCHTPRDSQGQLIRSHWLEGAAVWFQPAANTNDWPLKAPRIAGSPPASEAAMIKLLTTGIWTNGRELRPPMPQFRLTREDAEAVVAYLKSLNPEAQH